MKTVILPGDLVPAGIMLAVLAVIIAWIAAASGRRRVLTGNEGMIGLTGIVSRRRGFRNRFVIEVRGELWWCRSTSALEQGMEVVITGISGLVLEVTPTGERVSTQSEETGR